MTTSNRILALSLCVAGLAGACGPGGPGAEQAGRSAQASPEEAAGPTGDASILPRPFTAEQIRNEWVPGLTLTMRRATPEGVALERWTVLSADAEGAEIEYATLDGDGRELDEPQVRRSGWLELRDHASFPAGSSRRDEAVRDTLLGKLEGWVYSVRDESAGTVSEFFFARELPGAPVHLLVKRGDETILELTQIGRSRPIPGGPSEE